MKMLISIVALLSTFLAVHTQQPKTIHEDQPFTIIVTTPGGRSSIKHTALSSALNDAAAKKTPTAQKNNFMAIVPPPTIDMKRNEEIQAARPATPPSIRSSCACCNCRACCNLEDCCKGCCGSLLPLGTLGGIVYCCCVWWAALNSRCPNDLKDRPTSAPSSCVWQTGPYECGDNSNIIVQGNSCYDTPTGPDLCDLSTIATLAKGYRLGNGYCCSAIDDGQFNTTGQFIYPNIPFCSSNHTNASTLAITKKNN